MSELHLRLNASMAEDSRRRAMSISLWVQGQNTDCPKKLQTTAKWWDDQPPALFAPTATL